MAIVPSYFSTLAESQNLQFLIDTSQLQLEQASVWRNWLNLGVPQMSLSFDAAIGRERISAAASLVDSDAPAPLRSRNKLELYKGKIPAIKEKFRMNQDDMRSIEVLRALPLAGGNNAALLQFLDRDVQEAAVSGDKRIDIMLLQAMSTLQMDITTTNNPDGTVFGTIDLLAQSYQQQGVPVVWTNAADSKPIDDIDNFLQAMRTIRGRTFDRILMSYDLWITFKKTAQVRDYLTTFYNTGKGNNRYTITVDTVNELMTANGLPRIEIINHVSVVEVDGVPTTIKPFSTTNVVFLPAGRIGTLFNAISMEDIHRSPAVSYARFGPTLVSKWAETDPLVEFTSMEMNAFPAVNIDNIFLLKTGTVFAGPFV